MRDTSENDTLLELLGHAPSWSDLVGFCGKFQPLPDKGLNILKVKNDEDYENDEDKKMY